MVVGENTGEQEAGTRSFLMAGFRGFFSPSVGGGSPETPSSSADPSKMHPCTLHPASKMWVVGPTSTSQAAKCSVQGSGCGACLTHTLRH